MKYTTTAERLKEIMQENSLRQTDILSKCEPYCKKYNVRLAKNDLSQYVNGKIEPGQEKLAILSYALNVSEAWLMGYDVPKQPRNAPIITYHQEFDDEVLHAMKVLASYSGYNFNITANQYSIETSDTIIKLSPKEVEDYVNNSIDKIRFVTTEIINNKLHDNIRPIKYDLPCDNN